MMLQVAGVEGRHIVLLLADSHITEEAMLADVNGLLNTGDVTGGLQIPPPAIPYRHVQTRLAAVLCSTLHGVIFVA
jgi:hypothetical protein